LHKFILAAPSLKYGHQFAGINASLVESFYLKLLNIESIMNNVETATKLSEIQISYSYEDGTPNK
jgi:hypothetical protein